MIAVVAALQQREIEVLALGVAATLVLELALLVVAAFLVAVYQRVVLRVRLRELIDRLSDESLLLFIVVLDQVYVASHDIVRDAADADAVALRVLAMRVVIAVWEYFRHARLGQQKQRY